MALEGTLDDFSLADIFQLIGIQRKTGVLTLRNSQETVTVTFHNGMVIGADSVPKKLEDRLGKVLVKTGLISKEQLDEALELQKKTLQKIGFIVVDQNYISRNELKEALQIQVTQMVYRLFRWNTGEYYFDQKMRVDPDSDESIPPMSAESILMEGIHMIDEWPLIQKRIRSFDTVFRATITPKDIVLEDSDQNGAVEDSEHVRLSRDEESVFRLIDGRSSVSEIIESSKLGEFHTCKAIYDLLERKIIEPVHTGIKIQTPTVMPFPVSAERRIDYRYLYPLLALLVGFCIYLSYSDPLRLFHYGFFTSEDSEKVKASFNHYRLQLVDSAVVMYFYSQGALPESLNDLVKVRYLRASDIADLSSRPFVYQKEGNTYKLSTPGDAEPRIVRLLSHAPATQKTQNGSRNR